jgi:uncharacterized protein with PQ loop repeat
MYTATCGMFTICLIAIQIFRKSGHLINLILITIKYEVSSMYHLYNAYWKDFSISFGDP